MQLMEMEPFRIDVPDAVLADLRERLGRTRFPAPAPGEPWAYGTDLDYLRDLCAYWREDYDWRAAEARLNAFPQFLTSIDGQRLHVLHVPSPVAGALPLVITHGWPGSIAEFVKIIGPLSDPAAHGGDPVDAFDVVCPSMPGYGFSGPTTERGWDVRRVAESFAGLMAGLGYDRYGAQGGDWGAMVSSQLALVDPQHVCGIHLNMVVAGPPPGEDFSGLSEKELAALTDMASYQEDGSGYARIQGTRPQTLGYGLEDSPAGLAGWIVEKFRAWTDCGGELEKAVSRDELLTNLMLYWVTGTAHSSARLYYETMKTGRFGLTGDRVEVPTGCAIFPREIIRPPRRWAEAAFNVTHWSEMDAGGHFAALEQPEALVDDIRTFFRSLRG